MRGSSVVMAARSFNPESRNPSRGSSSSSPSKRSEFEGSRDEPQHESRGFLGFLRESRGSSPGFFFFFFSVEEVRVRGVPRRAATQVQRSEFEEVWVFFVWVFFVSPEGRWVAGLGLAVIWVRWLGLRLRLG